MHCPKCDQYRLKPNQLSNGLAVFSCASCQGSLLPLLQFRQWSETHANEASDPADVVHLDADTKTALQCPKCERLMTKYRMSADTNRRLDICMHCHDTWLDQGEWQLLKQLGVQDDLPKIFTVPYQNQLVDEQIEQDAEKRLRGLFGADYERVADFKRWLEQHPLGKTIRDYLDS